MLAKCVPTTLPGTAMPNISLKNRGLGRMTFRQKHLLGIAELQPDDIRTILDLADTYAGQNRAGSPPEKIDF